MLGRFRNAGFLALVLIAVTLAGCADNASVTSTEPDGPGEVTATATTGGIRGVVVDASIVPVPDATVTLKETGATTTTDDKGGFIFNDLQPGFYSMEATKQLYDKVQATTQVVAGVSNPDAVKIQITKLTDQEPAFSTTKYDGYIFCSANVVIALSEECGEGVGIPGVGRVGGNPDNRAQVDFFLDGPNGQSLIVEAVWEPSLTLGAGGQGGGFNMGIYTDFSCDPVCGWSHAVDRKNSKSPMYLRNDANFAEKGFDQDTAFSTFTWAASDETGVLLEQRFTVFVTQSYVLPMPEGWSFVNSDPAPF